MVIKSWKRSIALSETVDLDFIKSEISHILKSVYGKTREELSMRVYVVWTYFLACEYKNVW